MISATILSPLLGGWRNVLFLFGVPPIILSLLWFITGRESGNGESPSTIVSTVPFRQALSHVIRIKEVWIIGIIAMGPAGALSGVTGYLPIYLRGIGWTSVGADSILTVLLASSTVGTIPIALLSDRLGLRKRILVPIVLIIVISLGLLPLANGTGVLALVILYGLFRGGFRTLINTFIVEVKGVGKAYAGTAVGVVSSLGMLAAFFFPPLGNSLADINLGLPFVLWTGLSGIAALGFFFVKETGRREDKII
jgi:cyanate permease